MTANEIIKALECCNKSDNGKGCFECPYRQYCPDCLRRRNEDTLDLINRLQAENKRLINNKCEDCAGCTQWLCDCSNERAVAIYEYKEKLIYEIVNRPPEKTPDGAFYMSGRVDRQNEIIDIINELAGVYVETQEKTETSE